MKRIFYCFLVMLPFLFTSCSKDEKLEGAVNTELIIGTWTGDFENWFDSELVKYFDLTGLDRVTFNSDGTCIFFSNKNSRTIKMKYRTNSDANGKYYHTFFFDNAISFGSVISRLDENICVLYYEYVQAEHVYLKLKRVK